MGKIKAMAHPKAGSKVQRNHVFVITESSVLAALNLNSGEIVWRQTLPASGGFESLRLHGKHLLTMSGGGIAHVWNTQDGTLEWDAATCDAEHAGAAATALSDAVFVGADVDGDGDERDVALLCGNHVSVRSGRNLVWEMGVEASKGALASLSIDGASAISDLPLLTVSGTRSGGGGGGEEGEGSAVAAAGGGEELVTLSYDLRTGAEESYDSSAAPDGGNLSGSQRIADGWHVSIGGGGKAVLLLDAREATIHSFPAVDLLPPGAARDISVEPAALEGHVLLHGSRTALLRLDTAGSPSLQVVHTFAAEGAVVASAVDGDSARIAALAVTADGTSAEVLSLSSEGALEGSADTTRFDEPRLGSSGGAVAVRAVLTTPRDKAPRLRLLLR